MNVVEVHIVDVKLLIYHVHSFVYVVVNTISVGIHSTNKLRKLMKALMIMMIFPVLRLVK